MRDLDYLKLLAKEYPTVKAASSEIINLMAIRGLPKGTEYFFSDLHGEYEAFIHPAPQCVRYYPREDLGDLRVCDLGRRGDRSCKPDLLSGAEYPEDPESGKIYRRLAENYDLPSGAHL